MSGRGAAALALDVGGLGGLVWAAAELHPTAGVAAGGLALLVLARVVAPGAADDVDAPEVS